MTMTETKRRPTRALSGIRDRLRLKPRTRVSVDPSMQVSATLFLILRRMRVPLITLIIIYTVSVFGLTLIPGETADGQPYRMGFFDAFYFMSYTATTIGFGEIPHPFTYGQRLWVVLTIYLTVIGWAYALGSLLTLVQDKAFRQALRLQQFSRTVSRLSEPFLLLAGYGMTGELLARSFDGLGRQLVIIDAAESRIEALGMDTYKVDIPALAGDARNPHHLAAAGLNHPLCEGVLAMTDNDEVNLAVTMAAALLRPDVPVVARTVSRVIADRMRRVRHTDGGQPVRPLRQPSADRSARSGVLPVAGVARGRARSAAAGTRATTRGRSVGRVRVRALRAGGHRRSPRGGAARHGHRAERVAGRQ